MRVQIIIACFSPLTLTLDWGLIPIIFWFEEEEICTSFHLVWDHMPAVDI